MMKKQKILHITSSLSLGGTEKTLQVFATTIDRTLFDVFVCGLFASGPRVAFLQAEGIDVLLPEGDSKKVIQFIKENNITIVHWHGMQYGYGQEHAVCIDILEFCHKNNIFVIETSPFSLFQKDLDELTDVKLCVSRTSLIKLFYKYPQLDNTSSERYGFLYNPLDVTVLEPYVLDSPERLLKRHLLGIQDNTIVLGKIGRANLWKWDDAIIDVAKILLAGGYDIKVLIRAAPETKMQQIHAMELSEYFIFLPETIDDAELADTYQMMDIMLHTSRIGESFGVSLVEGMYFGLPIVTSATDFRDFTLFDRDNSQIEIVQDGVNGYIEQTPDAMAQKIVALIQDVDTMRRISLLNKKYAQETFGNNILTRQLEEIYISKSIPKHLQYDSTSDEYIVPSRRDSGCRLLKINIQALYEKFRYHC